jgi:CarD family transcriptional regulator
MNLPAAASEIAAALPDLQSGEADPATPATGSAAAGPLVGLPAAQAAAAPDAKAPPVNLEEIPAAQETAMPPPRPAEAKPLDTKTPDVKTAEARTHEPRPVNGMQGSRPVLPVRALAKEENFVEGDYVVYPTHGVGKVEKIAVEDIAGHRLELIHITFEENRMTLRVPVAKARTAGLRKLATQAKFDEALAVLRGRARIKRTMWSRRAQEYEAKINSGDPIAIAEVVRDLHRNSGQPDQSFSERQIYESAMDRLAAELAALDATDKLTAAAKLVNFLKAA